MKISALFQDSKPVFSFEFFPPRTPEGEQQLFQTIADLRSLKPGFVSITYGAGGSTRSRTVEWVRRIRELGLEPMAHLTCAGSSREEIASLLDELTTCTNNILALRGDPPRGSKEFQPAPGGFRYANELVAFVRERHGERFTLGGAGYPEGHPESVSLEADLQNLRRKVEAGLDFVITQLFFNNALYFGFVERARKAGIGVPIVPGLMPITNLAQVRKFMDLCGASIPGPLLSRLESVADDPQGVLEVGVEHATRQAAELLGAGAPGIHFYTLNKSPATRRVLENLR